MNSRERTAYLERRAAESAVARGGRKSSIAPLHRGVYAPVSERCEPLPKECALQHLGYMAAVRDLGYCMNCGAKCRPQFCHQDMDKGAGIKTDCRLGWPGCDACHALFGGHAGGGRLPKEERREREPKLSQRTREAVKAAGTWPARLPAWIENAHQPRDPG